MRAEALGVDAGASLVKLAHAASTRPRLQTFAAHALAEVVEFVGRCGAKVIGLTGGRASGLAPRLGGARVVPEFDAWIAGARCVAELDGIELPETHLLVSVGTGVSAILVHGATGQRVGGTALGGGSLVGLGRLLLGTGDFD